MSLVNTPLFVGFPGFVSKFWMAHDEHDLFAIEICNIGITDTDAISRDYNVARGIRVVDVEMLFSGKPRRKSQPEESTFATHRNP